MVKKHDVELTDVEQMLFKSASVEEFVHMYSKANPKLSKVELAKQAGAAWGTRPSLIQRIKRHASRFTGNGKKRIKHNISEIFVKTNRDRRV